MADLARVGDRQVGDRLRGVGKAEQPKGQRSPGLDRRPDILAETRRQRSMLHGVVERDRAVEMRSRLEKVARMQARQARDTMPDYERYGRRLLLRQGQELRRKLANHAAIERNIVRHPKTIEHREQHQWIFGGLPQRFRALYQCARLFE